MMTIAICIGSSCHLKGSEDLVEMFQKAISENGLENEIELIGSFCLGKCNRDGVTVQIDDDVFQGVNRENFGLFFRDTVMSRVGRKYAKYRVYSLKESQ